VEENPVGRTDGNDRLGGRWEATPSMTAEQRGWQSTPESYNSDPHAIRFVSSARGPLTQFP